jgi:hypothetical protein
MLHIGCRHTRPRFTVRRRVGTMLMMLAAFSVPLATPSARGAEGPARDAAAPPTQVEKVAPLGQSDTAKPSDPAQEPQQKPSAAKSATSVNPITGFGAVSGAQYVPLTGKERRQMYLSQTYTSVGAWFGPVTSSLIDQVNSQPPEWGGGIEGYGKRLASRFGTGVVQSTVQAIGCAALRQDPRYVRSPDTGAWHRIGHAFLFTILTKNNDGNTRLGIATLGSYYVAGMVSQSWMPSRFTALGDGVRDGNRQVIISVLLNNVQEFWPEIRRFVFRRP